jgi:hypothetical protein
MKKFFKLMCWVRHRPPVPIVQMLQEFCPCGGGLEYLHRNLASREWHAFVVLSPGTGSYDQSLPRGETTWSTLPTATTERHSLSDKEIYR